MAAKLIVSFERLGEEAFGSKARTIGTNMADNAWFPRPWIGVQPEELQAGVTRYLQLQQESQSRDSMKIILRRQARQELEGILKQLAPYLELVAQGDEARLASTGFDLRRESVRGAPVTELSAPESVRPVLVQDSGVLELRVSKLAGAVAYEVQTTQGDPLGEADWAHAMTSTSAQRIRVGGVKSGRVWARVRGINGNLRGAWSRPVNALVG